MNKTDEIPSSPPIRPRSVRLETAKDARKFLARLINKTYRDEIDGSKAGRIGYLLGIFIKSIEVSELESRLEALESRLGGAK